MVMMMVMTMMWMKDHDDVVDNVDDVVDISVEDGDDDSVDNGVDDAVEHLTHLSQVVDCHMTQRSKQNKHVVGNKDHVVVVVDGVEDGVDNSVKDGDDDSHVDGVDEANKHLKYLSQGVDCHLTQRSKQNKH
eukprot:13803692-Ditylum_brightwellii.AAC.1